MFEGFPYTNFHELNLDWIIKIAKDFLDQYTNIQQMISDGEQSLTDLISQGLADLDEKAENLEGLLQAWYNTHSEDIANELAQALLDISNTLSTTEAAFDAHAEAKAAETLASIPADYSALSAQITNFNRALLAFDTGIFEKGSLNAYGADDSYLAEARARTQLVYIDQGLTITSKTTAPNAKFAVHYFSNTNTFVSKSEWISGIYIPKGSNVRILIALDPSSATAQTLSDLIEGFDFITDTTGICQGSISNVGADDNSWKYRERLRDSYIKYADTDIEVIPFGGAFTVTTYTAAGAFIAVSGWYKISHVITKGTYYRCTFRINDTTAFPVSSFSTYFEINRQSNFIEHIINHTIGDLFRRGTFSGTDFTDWAAAKRIATSAKLKASKDIVIYYKNFYYDIYLFDNSGNITQHLSWRQNDIVIPANTYFSMNIDKDKNDSSATATFDDLINSISFEVSENNYIGMSPNIIYQCRNVDSLRYPPYSKWYIQAASKNQYDRIRLNIRVTTDGYFVLIHDNTINSEARNSNGTAISEPVNSSGQSLATLNSYDWGIKYGAMYAGAQVPIFEDACEYAAMYNLGVTIETVDLGTGTETIRNNIDKLYKILAQYGLIENLIVITASGSYYSEMEYWKTKSKYISYFIGGNPATIMTQKDDIDSLITGYNHIYVMPYPFGSVADWTLINWCMTNGYRLYNSSAMTKSELFNLVGIDTGNTLIEANDVYVIKNIVNRHADSIVNA